MLSITLIIIILTAIVSFTAFSNQKIQDDLIFYPPAVTEHNQWYRFWSCAFIHSDIAHLAFNMLSLFFFGEAVENSFEGTFPGKGKLLYISLYLIAQFFCLVPTFLKHKHNYEYKSLGASGAVSAVVFVGMMLYPTSKIGILIIPPIIPAYIFAPLYLIISAYMGKRGNDNINHSAHIWGALTGVLFLLITSYTMSTFDPVRHLINEISESYN